LRPPTTDTYSLPQTQEEFYFSLSLDKTDLCLYGHDNGLTPAQLAPIVGLSEDQVKRAYEAVAAKRRAAEYLHATAALVG
jgi:NAD+ synthase